MNHYQQSLTIAATPGPVYAALATTEGLRAWWTGDCGGTTGVNGILHFRFGATYKKTRIERLEPGREVRWQCTLARIAADALTRKDEWVGTELVWRMSDAGQGRTCLDFEHVGLDPSLECHGLCYKGWQYFMGSLQHYLETGEGTPYVAASTPANASIDRSQPA